MHTEIRDSGTGAVLYELPRALGHVVMPIGSFFKGVDGKVYWVKAVSMEMVKITPPGNLSHWEPVLVVHVQ